MSNEIVNNLLKELVKELNQLSIEDKIDQLNIVRETLHKEVSPFVNEPVDFVKWVKVENTCPNNYNPNHVAKPEMDLLYTSIKNNGVGFPLMTGNVREDSKHTIVDGFHRHLTISNRSDIRQRLLGYAPIAILDLSEEKLIAATVEFNRARGKHQVELMANLVKLLIDKKLSNNEIANYLGMQPEELLRLKQVKGIAEILANKEYSKSWEVKQNEK
jgi:hypothetical protein